jgi:ligand-binding SRPBCC domain-containing protein
MEPLVFEASTEVSCPAETLFRWHEEPQAFQRLMPPGEPVRVLRHDGHVRDGAQAVLLVGFWPVRFRWELEHRDYLPGRRFCDVQLTGPFTTYRHEHLMEPRGEKACLLTDRITYRLPGGWLGRWLGGGIAHRKFTRLFAFRHRVTREAFAS